VPIGDAVAIDVNGIAIVLNTVRAQCFEPTLFSNLGIDPTARRLLVVKSTNHFFAAFRRLSDVIIYCEAGRPYPNNPKATNYRKARLNIWPRIDNPFGESVET
jgi:microcystin degradation protein MlrC